MADKLTDDDALVDAIAEVIASFFGEHDSPADAARAILPLIAAREATARAEGYAAAREDAADMLDGKRSTVIPLLASFASLVSGNQQPCMSGDARDRLRAHVREDFDQTIKEIAGAIRNMGGEHGAD